MRQILRIIIATMLVSVSIGAQERSWDLSYESGLERNNVEKSEWIWTWLKTTKSPAVNWISEWKGKSIVSSILIEHPAFHAADRTRRVLRDSYCTQTYTRLYNTQTSSRLRRPMSGKALPFRRLLKISLRLRLHHGSKADK